jgi:hypothetical protein
MGAARSFFLGILIVAATVCLVLGLTLPIVKLTRLYMWTDVHSMISILEELYNANEVFLAVVICLFSVVFPFIKLLYLLGLYSARHIDPHRRSRLLKRMGWLGKWSMLDVLVLALVIFYAKSTKLADAVSMPGIYMFAAAVVLTMLAYGLVEYEGEKAPQAKPGERKDEPGGTDAEPPPTLHAVLSTPRLGQLVEILVGVAGVVDVDRRQSATLEERVEGLTKSGCDPVHLAKARGVEAGAMPERGADDGVVGGGEVIEHVELIGDQRHAFVGAAEQSDRRRGAIAGK